jgi:histidinol dehydrogenase
MASAILLTDSPEVLKETDAELARQVELLPKREIAAASLRDYGKAIVCGSIAECIEFANDIAPEHLELQVKDPMAWLSQVRNAGSVFLGYHTCESIGDYFGGTNHVLPTGGTARFSSALGVDAFIKKSSFLHYSREALQQDGEYIITMAEEEQLQAHANAVRVRIRR